MTKTRLYLLSLALFVVLFAAAFLSAELLLRYLTLRSAEETRDHVIQTAYQPAQARPNWQGQIWGIPFRTNLYGFRDEEDFDLVPGSGEYRILSLGDSIGFGLGVPSQAHYTKVAEELLNRPPSPHRYRVINAGGLGYSPSGYHVYLRHEGLRLQPNLVIVEIELCNDVTDEALLRWAIDAGPGGTLTAVRGGRYVIGWDGNLLATWSVGTPYFFERSYLYTDLLRRSLNLLYRLRPTEPFKSQSERGIGYYSLGFDRFLLNEQRIESGWERMFEALDQTNRMVRGQGASFLLMIVPSRYVFEEQSGTWQAFAAELIRRARTAAKERDIPFLDLTPFVSSGGGANLYFDFAHLTEEGNRVVGEALAEQLRVSAITTPERMTQAR
jgi:lysophospholipase L1-like esterase